MSSVSRFDLGVLASARPIVAVRLALARRPWWRAVAVTGLAVVAGWAHLFALDGARRERTAWGETTDVWVAAGPHGPGDELRVELMARPIVVVPADAVRDDPVGRVARQHLADGEIVVDADLAPSASPVALAPPGSVVVPVADPLVTEALVGATVAVASEGVVLADAGTVVDVVDRVVFVAVPAADAPMVAAAAGRSLASLLFPAEPYGGHPP